VRTHVEFRSSAFPPQPGEDVQINPGRWGRLLAEYLSFEFRRRGLLGGVPYPEDWGWAIPLENKAFPLWVGCGNYEEHPDGFLCFIEPRKPYVWQLLRRINTTSRVEEVAVALDASLREHPETRDLRWWPDDRAAP
jgi:hypothetical protein